MSSQIKSMAACRLAFLFFLCTGTVMAAPVPIVDNPPANYGSVSDVKVDDEIAMRIRAYRDAFDDRTTGARKGPEEVQERTETGQQAFAGRMDVLMKKHAERQADMVKWHEAMRQRAEADRDYLYEHQQEMFAMALKRKDALVQHHEKMRQQAEARQAELERYRSTMQGMSADEWSAYFREHHRQLRETMQPPPFPPHYFPPPAPRWLPPSGWHQMPVEAAPEPPAGETG